MWISRVFHNMKVFRLVFMSGLLIWPIVGSADLYKWTDDQGNLHITDMPPPLTQKKSATSVPPAPRSASPKKTTVRPTLPHRPQAEIHLVPGSSGASPAREEVLIQRPMEGLNPNQATLTSSWRVFDGAQMNTKAPVQWWKDEQGLDHFADVVPITRGGPEAEVKAEDASVSRSTRRAKHRATSVSRSQHQTTE